MGDGEGEQELEEGGGEGEVRGVQGGGDGQEEVGLKGQEEGEDGRGYQRHG